MTNNKWIKIIFENYPLYLRKMEDTTHFQSTSDPESGRCATWHVGQWKPKEDSTKSEKLIYPELIKWLHNESSSIEEEKIF